MAITSQEINNHQLPIQEFLKLLWGDSHPKGYFSLWTKKGKTTREFLLSEEQDGLCREVENLKSNRDDIYFAIGLKSQKTGPSNRGVSSSILAIPGFWMDIDIKGGGHKEQELPENTEAALEIINQTPCEPTVIVHSGGGVHVYWFFKEPWILQTEDENKKAHKASKQFQSSIHQIPWYRCYSYN